MTVIESVFKKKYKVKLAEKMTIMSIFIFLNINRSIGVWIALYLHATSWKRTDV